MTPSEVTICAEPTFSPVHFFCIWCLPFGAYFLGIFIRRAVFSREDELPFSSLVLLGIPLSLGIVSPLIYTLQEAFLANRVSYLLTIGIIIEQGMTVHEAAMRRILERVDALQE